MSDSDAMPDQTARSDASYDSDGEVKNPPADAVVELLIKMIDPIIKVLQIETN